MKRKGHAEKERKEVNESKGNKQGKGKKEEQIKEKRGNEKNRLKDSVRKGKEIKEKERKKGI